MFYGIVLVVIFTPIIWLFHVGLNLTMLLFDFLMGFKKPESALRIITALDNAFKHESELHKQRKNKITKSSSVITKEEIDECREEILNYDFTDSK